MSSRLPVDRNFPFAQERAAFSCPKANYTMSGFVGRINLEDGSSQDWRAPLRNGLRFLRRRGPDGTGYWQSPEGRVELAHARLTIRHRASLSQPFCDPATDLTIACDGEIYNDEELRRELAPHPFRTRSDVEVTSAVFSTWGIAGLKRLRGAFACAIVDSNARRVYLIRDPIGKKPLYVACWPGGIWFGSSVVALAATYRGETRLQEGVLDAFWHFTYIPPYRSVLADCKPVLPGQVLEFDWDGHSHVHSCCPDVEGETPKNLEEIKERVSILFRQSVTRRLQNNPTPVSLVSGGIDSTNVTNQMWKQAGGQALTLGNLIPGTLDEKYARYAAWRIGVPLEVVRPPVLRLEEEINWALDLQDEPTAVLSFFALALLLKRAKTYGQVLLTGDGGDEVFLGYGMPADWSDPNNGADEYDAKARGVVVGVPPPAWMSPWGQYTVGHALLGHMFTKLDRAASEQGMEARCPMVDWDMIAFVRGLTPEQLFFCGRPKSLTRALLGDWPRWFMVRTKVGFAYRLRWAWWLRNYRGMRDLVSSEAIETFGERVPGPLRCSPNQWKRQAILKNFLDAWKLLVWSRFSEHLRQAKNAALTPDEHPLGVLTSA
jgi:asparagine synthase (glutamine-hydrolysing)